MQLADFQASIEQAQPPDLPGPLRALWWQRKGEFDRAHQLVQDDPSPAAAWVQAYLHRVEGDSDNAGYWYRRAGQPVCDASLATEWQSITDQLLSA